jgi:phosphate/sulfate permease
MVVIVPLVYLFGCLVSGLVISALRRLALWKAVLLCLVLTPLLGGIIAMYLKARPKAYCMQRYLHFEVGSPYTYRSVWTKRYGEQIWVYSDQVYKMHPKTFNKYFSQVIDQPETVSYQRSFKSL